jgi:hypothetical protein
LLHRFLQEIFSRSFTANAVNLSLQYGAFRMSCGCFVFRRMTSHLLTQILVLRILWMRNLMRCTSPGTSDGVSKTGAENSGNSTWIFLARFSFYSERFDVSKPTSQACKNLSLVRYFQSKFLIVVVDSSILRKSPNALENIFFLFLKKPRGSWQEKREVWRIIAIGKVLKVLHFKHHHHRSQTSMHTYAIHPEINRETWTKKQNNNKVKSRKWFFFCCAKTSKSEIEKVKGNWMMWVEGWVGNAMVTDSSSHNNE